jgi:inner membrane protein
MASVFGHSLVAIAFGKFFREQLRTPKFWLLGVMCTIFPDADVLGFKFGVDYDSFWGHRGFTHSLVFAALFGVLVAWLFYSSRRPILAVYFALCTASHSLLDAMTSGGRGVAFLSPFDDTRYFLPWRPIKVSPLGAKRFFSEWGLEVLKTEAIYIGIPVVIVVVLVIGFRSVNVK